MDQASQLRCIWAFCKVSLREAVWCRRPQIWRRGHWGLPHDGAPMHHSNLVQKLVAKSTDQHSISTLLPTVPTKTHLITGFSAFFKEKSVVNVSRTSSWWKTLSTMRSGRSPWLSGSMQWTTFPGSVNAFYLKAVTLNINRHWEECLALTSVQFRENDDWNWLIYLRCQIGRRGQSPLRTELRHTFVGNTFLHTFEPMSLHLRTTKWKPFWSILVPFVFFA